MKSSTLAILSAVALAGCATVSNETRTPAFIQSGFYEGTRYDIRTRTIDGPTGSFEQTSVVYNGMTKTCIPSSPRDCELAAEDLISGFDEPI